MPGITTATPPPRSRGGRVFAIAAALLALVTGVPAWACSTGSGIATDLGSVSPAAIAAGAVPALRSSASFSCSSGVLMLLSGNYIRATYQSRNGLKLLRSGGGAIGYVLSADPDGKVVAAQGGTIDYMQNNLLNLLGLLGGSSADLPFFVRPAAGTAPAVGSYTDRITIKWDWYLCQGIGALGLCLLGADSGTATTIIDVTLTVAPKAAVVTTSIATIWDPVNGTRAPRSVPGSRQRISVTVANPDLVPTAEVAVVVPLHAGQSLALDPVEGSTDPAFGVTAAGGPAPRLVYTGPAATADDIDFSADGGRSWTHAPVEGALRTDAIRLRPQGSLAPGASLTVSLPVAVR